MSDQEPFSDNDIIPLSSEPETYTVEALDAAPERRRGRSGCFYGVVGMVGCLILLLIIPVTLIILGVTSVGGVLGGLGGLFGVSQPPSATVISSQTIVEGIQPLGQLVSISTQLAKADVQVNVSQGAFNACGFSANHVVQGTIEAGIDLTKISPGDLVYDPIKQTYTLTVPDPELTSCRVDYIRQYDRSFTTCSIDWDEARLLANYMALTQFRDDAIEGGILTRAQEETKLVLGNFVRLVTGHPVVIQFAPQPAATEMPSSCTPDIPAGWTYSSATNNWNK